MKKIAFYVEGLTEQSFVTRLLEEIAGVKKIDIELQQFQGKGRPTKNIIHSATPRPTSPSHHALILNCVGDGGVKPRILEDYQRLFSQGYTEVVGLLDLYPRTDLVKFENYLEKGVFRNGVSVIDPLPKNTSIAIAVNEVESWFLAEHYHFLHIDTRLTGTFIMGNLGFNPCVDDMTLRTHPAMDLHQVYQIVGEAYMDANGKKSKVSIKRTVDCLDYAEVYVNLSSKINQLNLFVSKIDSFLSP